MHMDWCPRKWDRDGCCGGISRTFRVRLVVSVAAPVDVLKSSFLTSLYTLCDSRIRPLEDAAETLRGVTPFPAPGLARE